MEKQVLGIITARGGSKGIPGKNIKPLLGKPLLAYTIEVAKEAGIFDRLILTTDDEMIAAVGREYGCEVPFMRPKELAEDGTPSLPVVQHAVRWLHGAGYQPAYVMLLQPTSPLRQAFHIRESFDLLVASGADSVVGVAEIPKEYHPARAMALTRDGHLVLYGGDPVRRRPLRRQDLAKAYWSTTSIYCGKSSVLFDPIEPSLFGNSVMPYIIDGRYAIDIDVPSDWERAEKALQQLQLEK